MEFVYVTVLIDRSSSTQEFVQAINNSLSKLVFLFNNIPEGKGINIMLSVAQFPVFPGESIYVINKESTKEKKKYTFNITSRGNTDPTKSLLTVANDLIAYTKKAKEEFLVCKTPLLIYISDGELNAGTNIPGGRVDPDRQQKLLERYEDVCETLKVYQKGKKINFFAFGLKNADKSQLEKLTICPEKQIEILQEKNIAETVRELLEKIYNYTLNTLDLPEVAKKQLPPNSDKVRNK